MLISDSVSAGFRLFLLATTMIVAPLAAAHAQTAAPAVELEQINVEGASGEEKADGGVKGIVAKKSATGTKTGTPLIRTPQSVNVIGREEAAQRGAGTVTEALRYTPGVVTETRPASRYDIGFIRGLGGLQNWFDFLDGMRMPRGVSFNAPIMDPWNIERIEVLKGPASVLYGQIMPGGMINQVTKKPDADAVNELAFTVGTDDRIEAAFDLSAASSDEKFLYRLVGLGRHHEGNIAFSETERVFIAPSVTWQPTDATSFTVQAGYMKDPDSHYSVPLPYQGTLAPRTVGGVDHYIPYDFSAEDPGYSGFEREQIWAGYQFEHAFSEDVEFRSKLRYMEVESLFHGLQITGYAAPNTTILNRRTSLTDDWSQSVVTDNQLEWKFDTGPIAHTALVGVDYLWLNSDQWSGQGPTGNVNQIDFRNPVYYQAIPTPALTQYTEFERKQLGVYFQEQFDIGGLTVIGGVRQDWAELDQVAVGVPLAIEQDALTYRVGAIYQFDNGIAPYASYATSFEPTTQAGTSFGGAAFDPTTGEQVEVGVKYQPTWIDALFTVAFFDINQDGLIFQGAGNGGVGSGCLPDPLNCAVQTGKVNSRGVEFEVKARLAEGLDVIGGYSYTDVETKEAYGSTPAGTTPAMVPTHQASLWAYYTFNEASLLGGFGLGGGVRYIGESYANPSNTLGKVPDHTLFDAAAHYDFGVKHQDWEGLRLTVSATNITDEEYLAGCQINNNSAAGSGCYYGSSRTAKATLSYKW
jgi:iron complex outermembrane receptor protein